MYSIIGQPNMRLKNHTHKLNRSKSFRYQKSTKIKNKEAFCYIRGSEYGWWYIRMVGKAHRANYDERDLYHKESSPSLSTQNTKIYEQKGSEKPEKQFKSRIWKSETEETNKLETHRDAKAACILWLELPLLPSLLLIIERRP